MVSESPTQRPQVPYDTGVSVFPRSSGLAEKVKARGSPPSLKRLTATTPLASRSQRYSTSADDADTSSGTRLVPVGSAASDGRHAEAPAPGEFAASSAATTSLSALRPRPPTPR